jgi:hypothetical protein
MKHRGGSTSANSAFERTFLQQQRFLKIHSLN